MTFFIPPESEFKEFKPRLNSAKNRFQFSTGLNLEKFNTILNETLIILEKPLKFKPRLAFLKFGRQQRFKLLSIRFSKLIC